MNFQYEFDDNYLVKESTAEFDTLTSPKGNEIPKNLVHQQSIEEEILTNRAIHPYNPIFNMSNYFRYWAYHLFYFLAFGPFICILSPIIGRFRLKNMLFTRPAPFTVFQTIQWMFVVFALACYIFLDTGVISRFELVMILCPVFTRIMVVATKYGYHPKQYLERFESEIIPVPELMDEWLLNKWRQQDIHLVDEELKASILRTEIDLGSFYFGFLGKSLER